MPNIPALNTNFVADFAGAHRNALGAQGQAYQNQLAAEQVQNIPQQREIGMMELQLKRTALEIQKKALEKEDTGEPISIDYPEFAVKGPKASVIAVSKAVAQFPDQVKDPNFPAWVASQGVSYELRNDSAKGGLKVGATRTRHEKIDGRWMKHTEEYDGANWSRVDTVPLYKTSASERLDEKRMGAIGKIENLPPMEAYAQGWRMEDDGRLYIDAATGAPEKLKPFTNTLGKRANMKIIKEVGEHVDDSLEIYTGLQDPVVQADLKKASNDGMWDKVEGRWSNAVKAWMMRNGISGGSKTFKTIMHMQRMASEQRKTMLGTAVTQTELESILAWMPNAGDSYETMLGKITLAAEEGYEDFKRWLDINKDTSNMAPFYKAWGLDRFNMPDKGIKSLSRSGMAGPDALPPQTPIQKRGDELAAQGLPEDEIIRTLQREFPRRADNKR